MHWHWGGSMKKRRKRKKNSVDAECKVSPHVLCFNTLFVSLLESFLIAPSMTTVFDIPELLVCICQYLTQHDMAQCVATSKSFARVFEPFLYQHFYDDSRQTFDSSGLI